jgi:UDP-N-acetylmuramyl tripeptide synthase
MKSDLHGLELKVRVKEESHDFKTNIILNHNALNITCAISIIEALGIFNANLFANYISNINIPGREEIIRFKDRTIIIGVSLNPALENFKRYKQNSNINKIKVVVGSIGTGFVSWSQEFNTQLFKNKRSYTRSYAMNYLKKYADYAYITSNDNAAEDPYNIAKELQGYLNNEIPSEIIIDREDAIKKAILESEPNDLIYIAGRGNRRILCNSKNTVKLIQDKETVEDMLGDL